MAKQHQITVFAKPNGAWARAAKSKSTKTSPSPTSPSDPIIQKSKNLTSTFTEIRLISSAGNNSDLLIFSIEEHLFNS